MLRKTWNEAIELYLEDEDVVKMLRKTPVKAPPITTITVST